MDLTSALATLGTATSLVRQAKRVLSSDTEVDETSEVRRPRRTSAPARRKFGLNRPRNWADQIRLDRIARAINARKRPGVHQTTAPPVHTSSSLGHQPTQAPHYHPHDNGALKGGEVPADIQTNLYPFQATYLPRHHRYVRHRKTRFIRTYKFRPPLRPYGSKTHRELAAWRGYR